MTATEHPGVWTRVVAALHGEVSAATWEAYRDAGQAVFDVLAENEAQRKAEVGEQSVGAVSGRVATWNALVLQLLGEALIDADYAADPRTVGFLPKVTAEQVGRVLTQAEPWLALARQAQADPGLDITKTVHLPAVLPAWVKVEPCPSAHCGDIFQRDGVQGVESGLVGHATASWDRFAAPSAPIRSTRTTRCTTATRRSFRSARTSTR